MKVFERNERKNKKIRLKYDEMGVAVKEESGIKKKKGKNEKRE